MKVFSDSVLQIGNDAAKEVDLVEAILTRVTHHGQPIVAHGKLRRALWRAEYLCTVILRVVYGRPLKNVVIVVNVCLRHLLIFLHTTDPTCIILHWRRLSHHNCLGRKCISFAVNRLIGLFVLHMLLLVLFYNAFSIDWKFIVLADFTFPGRANRHRCATWGKLLIGILSLLYRFLRFFSVKSHFHRLFTHLTTAHFLWFYIT